MKNLSEGIKITSKERQKVKDNIDLFQMGVEYEFHTNLPISSDTLADIDEAGFYNIIEISSSDTINIIDYMGNPDLNNSFVLIQSLNLGVASTPTDFIWSHTTTSLVGDDTTVYDNILDILGMDSEEKIKSMCEEYIELVTSISSVSLDQEIPESVTNQIQKFNEEHADTKDVFYWFINVSNSKASEILLNNSEINYDDLYFMINIEKDVNAFLKYVKENSDHILEVFENPEDNIIKIFESFEFDDDESVKVFLEICNVSSYCDSVDVMTLPNSISDLVSDEYDVEYDDVYEDDGQIELRTYTESIPNGMFNMDRMFSFIEDHATTDETSGMHISVSLRDSKDRKNADLVKFLVLSEIGHVIDTAFPERNHVKNIIENIESVIQFEVTHEDGLLLNDKRYIIPFLTKEILNSDVFTEKYQSIKFGDYNALNGRIELRYFGGENYHERYDEIEEELYRILFILMVSYTDEYNKEYKKTLFKLIDRYIEEEYEHSKTLSLFKRLVRKYGEQPSEEELQEIYDVVNKSDLPKQSKNTIKDYYI